MKHFFLVMFAILALKSTAQQTIESIDFLQFIQNPNPPIYAEPCSASYKQHYVIRIDNFNRSVYKVEDSINQVDFNTDLPSAFEGIKLPTYFNYSLPDKMKTPSGEASTVTKTQKSDADLEKEIETSLLAIRYANKAFERVKNLESDLKNLASSCNLSYTAIRAEANRLINQTISDTSLNNRCSTIASNLEAFIRNHITCAENSLDALKLAWHEYKGRIFRQEAVAAYQLDRYNKRKEVLDKIKNPTEENKAELKDIETQIDLLRANLEIKFYQLKREFIDESVIAAGASVSEMQKFRSENKIQLLLNRNLAINESNFTYYTDWFRAEKDLTTLELKITTTSTEPIPCNVHNQYRIMRKYYTNGGWKVDFSGGVFFNGGPEAFFDREPYYQSVTATESKIIDKDSGARLLMSVGALMHLYKRTCAKNHFAGSIGISAAVDFTALNFHTGLSYIFGRKNRLVITIGPTLRQATILDRRFEFDTIYAKDILPEVPPTIKVFPRVGGFLALTYNWERLDKN